MEQDFTNHFLISTSGGDNDIFASSLVYVCLHDSEGAFGLVLNKPSSTTTSALFESLKIPIADDDSLVLRGGPVKPEQVIILHTLTDEYDMTIKANSDIGVTLSQDILTAVSEKRGPEKYLFTLGYTGWGSGQIESEVNRNDWIVIPATPEIIFDTPIHARLTEATRRFGFDVSRLSDATGNA